MATKRQYTEDEKAEALAFLAANQSGGYKAAAKQTGIPWTTIRDWERALEADESLQEKTQQKKGDLADALEEKIWLMVGGLDERKIADAPVNTLTTGIGTLLNTVRLLREQATEINAQILDKETTVRIEYVDNPPTTPASGAEGDHSAGATV